MRVKSRLNSESIRSPGPGWGKIFQNFVHGGSSEIVSKLKCK